jgi:hypothetical protein
MSERRRRRQAAPEERAIGIPLIAAHLLTADWSIIILCPIEPREVIHDKHAEQDEGGATKVDPIVTLRNE